MSPTGRRPGAHPPSTTLAFCGAGHISGVHGLAAKALPALAVTHVASRTPARAAERAEQLGARPCRYDDLPAGADIVLVSTPPAQHANDVMRALQGGAAAIVEKPLTTTLDEADQLVEAAARSGGRIGYAENLAFAPVVRRAVQRIGELGPLQLLALRTLHTRPTWGGFLRADWGGGVLFDLGPHPIAVALLLAAPARPTSVAAELQDAPGIEVDDHADVTLEFDSGLRATFVVSWRQGPDEAVSDIQASSATGVLRIELFPNFGLEIDGEPVALPALRPGLPSPQLERMGYLDQLEGLCADLTAGREPMMDAAFGRDVLDVVCGAYASAGRGGRPVPLPFAGPRDRTPLQLWRAPAS